MDNKGKTLRKNVNNIFIDVYYVFFLRWAGKIRSEDEVIKMTKEARELSSRHGDIDLILNMTVNLATLLELEYRGGSNEEK